MFKMKAPRSLEAVQESSNDQPTAFALHIATDAATHVDQAKDSTYRTTTIAGDVVDQQKRASAAAAAAGDGGSGYSTVRVGKDPSLAVQLSSSRRGCGTGDRSMLVASVLVVLVIVCIALCVGLGAGLSKKGEPG
jgi:hypothetical protein